MVTDGASKILATSSGVAVVERGAALWVVDLGTGSAATAIFVLGLITGIGGIGGFVLLFAVGWAGLAPLALGLLAAGGLALTLRWKRAREQLPVESLRVLCVFDPQRGTVMNAAGQPFAHLAQVQIGTAFQIASSSPALQLVHPGGKLVLVRGNPFAGGIHDVEFVLKQRLGR